MSHKTAEIRFAGVQQVEFLTITVRGRAYRQNRDDWDGNWLLVTVALHAGKFTGEVPGLVRAEELEQFNGELQSFSQTHSGSVSFKTKEEWLSLRVEGDKPGSILVFGTINDEAVYPYNSLKFSLKIKKDALAAALQQVEQAVKTFPVVGKP